MDYVDPYEDWINLISRCEDTPEPIAETNPYLDKYYYGFSGLRETYFPPPTVLYRVLSPIECIDYGIFSKADCRSSRTVAQHIASGSRYPSRFISTTLDLNVAANWAYYEMEKRDNGPRAEPLRIVEIDIQKLVGTETEKYCINLCDKEVREHFIRGHTHRSWAMSSHEVLFQYEIPKCLCVPILHPYYGWSFYFDEVYHVVTNVLKPPQPRPKKLK